MCRHCMGAGIAVMKRTKPGSLWSQLGQTLCVIGVSGPIRRMSLPICWPGPHIDQCTIPCRISHLASLPSTHLIPFLVPLHLTRVRRLRGSLIPLSDFRYSLANTAQDYCFCPLFSSAWIHWVPSVTIPWAPRTWMERKDPGKEVLACHPQAASLGPGARMLAWTASAPQKRLRLGPGLCTTTTSFRAVCSKLAFPRPRIVARHLVQVPQGSTKGVSQRQRGIFSCFLLAVQAGSSLGLWFCLKAKLEGRGRQVLSSKTSGQGPHHVHSTHPAPWKSTISFAHSVELKLLE